MKLINNINVDEINSLVLAYIGDCVYENYIRHYLVSKGISNVNDLQKEAVKYVSATAQSNAIHKMIDWHINTVYSETSKPTSPRRSIAAERGR